MTGAKVAVALSGGVDSSVAALLLKEAGYEVTGIHMQLGHSLEGEHAETHVDVLCHTLGIPLYTVDLQKEFDLYVVDRSCREYRRGRTPNPCVICNQRIKFGFLLHKALSLGADYFATGHYARIDRWDDRYHLLKAVDTGKDQSYFLYALGQEILRYVLFPSGAYSRDEVQGIAGRMGLPVRRSSQDICFVSRKNYPAFMAQHSLYVPGDITDTRGKRLGEHHGIARYTIGQRRGLGVASGRPLYVTRIEPEHNRIVLGNEEDLYSQRVAVSGIRWVAGKPPSRPINVAARTRYRSRETEATLCLKGQGADVCLAEPQRAVTPGQAIVFYDGDEVLGGGTIESSEPVSYSDRKA